MAYAAGQGATRLSSLRSITFGTCHQAYWTICLQRSLSELSYDSKVGGNCVARTRLPL